jgi:tetratricopeptide (TPR) repeat protein
VTNLTPPLEPVAPDAAATPPAPPRLARAARLGPSPLRWAAALLLVATTAAAMTFFLTAASHARGGAARARLAPDGEALRYRHPIDGDRAAASRRELDDGIAGLEERARQLTPSPFDLNELADLYFRRGRLTADLGDYARAEELARRSLALLPTPNAAVLVLAKLANTRHDFRGAIELARQHQHGLSTGAHTALATAYLALGELATAAEETEALVRAQPTSSSYFLRALVMQAQGRDDEAAFDFTRAALAEESGDPQEAARLRALWARFLLRRGELAGAGRLIGEALRIAPGYPLALAQRGELLLRRGEAKAAAAQFEQAFAASRQVRYLIDQARALEQGGARPAADALRAQVEQLVSAELTEGGLGHRLDLIEVLVDRGGAADLTRAIALGREELAHRPSAETRYQLARALTRAGQSDDALAQVQAALASGAHEPQLYELAARLETRRHNSARAALYGRLARELSPESTSWLQAGMGAP